MGPEPVSAQPPPRLSAERVSKTFGPVRVLDADRLTVRRGEVHGLIGENGSGKSTLVKVLTGYHAPDPGGTVRVDGRPLRLPVRWADARAAGISVVHQDLGLVDHLTVAENICVGGYRRSRWLRRIDWRHSREVATQLLSRLRVDADPDASAGSLPAGARAGVAIARALRDHVPGSGLIILDEANRLLAGEDLRRFHRMLRDLAGDGTSVLMVSHNLEEVLAVTDRVTVLRDGRVSGAALATASLTEAELARRMLGTTVSAVTPRRAVRRREAAVVTGLHGEGVAGLDLALGEGEVVGLTGLPGSGFEAIPYLLAGTRPAQDGTVEIAGARLQLRTCDVRTCMRAGIVLVPERRERDGLAFELTVADNVALPALVGSGRHYVSKRWQRQQGQQAIQTLGVRANSPLQLVKQLSGGNQQKVLLAKWLSVKPTLLVLHEPTQAVDVGARADLLRSLHHVADVGTAVLLVSTEPADLIAACDRILLFRPPGELVELRASTPDQVLDAVYGSNAVSQDGGSERMLETIPPRADEPRPETVRPRPRAWAHQLPARYGLVGVWLVMAAVFLAAMPSTFGQTRTLQSIFGSQQVLVFLVLAALCTLVVGEFDLSVASIMGLSATIIPVLAGLHHVNVVVACAVALLACVACGALNAFFVVRVGVMSLVVTLGSGTLFIGIAEAISSSSAVSVNSSGLSQVALFSVGGLRVSFYYGLAAAIAFAFLLGWTPLGRHLVFVGSNREVARLAGIRVNRIRAGSYIVAGLVAGFAGLVLVASDGGFDPTASVNYLLPALAATFLGTAVVQPGQFNPIGSLIGIYFLETGIFGLQLFGYSGWIQDVFYGGGLVAAVAVATVVRQRAAV